MLDSLSWSPYGRDEEDFLSADEGVSDEDHRSKPVNHGKGVLNPDKPGKIAEQNENEKSALVSKIDAKTTKVQSDADHKGEPESPRKHSSARSDYSDQSNKSPKDVQDDDDEEALADRIRERNLKLARKFSAEINRSVRASAPIPVRGASLAYTDMSDIDPNIPGTDTHSSNPPAPPSTPAYSSSVNTDSQGTPETSWGGRQTADPKLESGLKIQQTRLALDKLSERASQSDKNLFERVAQDLKNVSIKSRDSSDNRSPLEGDNAPSSSESVEFEKLEGFDQAKLIEIGSRIVDSCNFASSFLKTVSDHLQAKHDELSRTQPQEPAADTEGKAKGSGVSKSATGTVSSDAFLDLTLNTMESLGKRAFGAMTERDESGSLQIKGIGRPWEHLLNTKKVPETKHTAGSSQSSFAHGWPDPETLYPSTSQSDNKVKDDGQHSALKNRKKHSTYADDDKLD